MEKSLSESPSGRPTMATLTPLNELIRIAGETDGDGSYTEGQEERDFRHNGIDEKDDSIVVVFQVDEQSIDAKLEFERSDDERHVDAKEEFAENEADMPYRCEVCQKGFARKHYLQRHVHVHSGERLHQCTQCPKGFSRKDHLTQHMSAHSGDLPFKCVTCGKSFARRDHFKRHLVMHTGEKNFECHICLRQFSRKDHKNKHVQVVHGIVAAVAPCPTCGKSQKQEHARCKDESGNSATSLGAVKDEIDKTDSATSTSTRTRKSRAQSFPQQNVSPSSGATAASVQAGVGSTLSLGVGGPQRFECSVCAKQFSSSSSLHRHGLVHSGERPFQCILCLKQFSRKYHLDRHIKVHNRAKANGGTSTKSSTAPPDRDLPMENEGDLLVASIKAEVSDSESDDKTGTGVSSPSNGLSSCPGVNVRASEYGCMDVSSAASLSSLKVDDHLPNLHSP